MVKAEIVPEMQRSAIYALIRVPLNLFVVGNLLLTPYLSDQVMFALNATFLMVACLLQLIQCVWRRSDECYGEGCNTVQNPIVSIN